MGDFVCFTAVFLTFGGLGAAAAFFALTSDFFGLTATSFGFLIAGSVAVAAFFAGNFLFFGENRRPRLWLVS